MTQEHKQIQSLQNPRIKALAKLRKSSARRKSGEMLVEGFREIQRAFQAGWTFKEIYFCPELFIQPAINGFLADLATSGIPLIQCSKNVFRKISYREGPDGLIAVSSLVGCKLADLSPPPQPLLLIAEGIEKPGNIGTLLRTADACGVDAVIICDPKTDINNPNVIRASIGTLFFMPISITSSSEALQWLSAKNIRIFTALPDASARYTDVNMQQTGCAIVVGSEDCGLSPAWKNSPCNGIHIPMLGKNDSLNVSTAASVILYEAVRQRNIHNEKAVQ